MQYYDYIMTVWEKLLYVTADTFSQTPNNKRIFKKCFFSLKNPENKSGFGQRCFYVKTKTSIYFTKTAWKCFIAGADVFLAQTVASGILSYSIRESCQAITQKQTSHVNDTSWCNVLFKPNSLIVDLLTDNNIMTNCQ